MSIESNLANVALIEEMYAKYIDNPASVDSSWHKFFDEFGGDFQEGKVDLSKAPSDIRVFQLINAYRTYGHLMAANNPVSTKKIEEPFELSLKTLGFKDEELYQEFPTCGLLPAATAPLSDIIKVLRTIYSDKIGVEYMGLHNPELELWLQQRIEPNGFKANFTIDQKKAILQSLNKSELFESFLHTKYVGQKRFSLEGAETFIPIMETFFATGASIGSEEFVIGMAHRGRLNILSNIMNKSYSEIFSEFEDGYIPESYEGSGDVKYHKGFLSEVITVKGHKVKVNLVPNPSHLESVDPVAEGQTKAKQIKKNDMAQDRVVPILVHGDAAVSGQGVIYETMQLCNLNGYSTGGSVHIVINNQIGFTTLPEDARSTRYCTDIAKTFGSPVFHVNAEDPEGCVYAAQLAMEIRQKFKCDVFIDLLSYRKYGHNESDEPAFTQPQEYQIIRKKKSIREIYRDDLIQQGVLERQMAEALEVEFKSALQNALTQLKFPSKEKVERTPVNEQGYSFQTIPTGVPKEQLQQLAKLFCTVPDGFKIHPKLENLLKERLEMVETKPMDWGMAETLAYATLLWNGTDVRISGQDVCRGTFSHRHGVWMDQVVEKAYFPLAHLKENQGRFDLINSPLSEFAILAFEFGYSVALQEALVIWEAQFGDFSNGAQIVIDEYITTCEQKWNQKSRLTLFLPHGFEGQGPDHSSGRMERYLSLCGDNNIQVVYPSTPAQMFHLLRRQMVQPYIKPLVVFTPKGLLRFPECVSWVQDLTRGSFQTVIDDPKPPKKANRLVLCSGRIYYDLSAAREKMQVEDLAIVRIEQLYPLDVDALKEVFEKYSVDNVLWVQEEPKNMGAWSFLEPRLKKILGQAKEITYVGRQQSASPANGSHAVHKKEQAAIINEVFGRTKPSIFEIASESKT